LRRTTQRLSRLRDILPANRKAHGVQDSHQYIDPNQTASTSRAHFGLQARRVSPARSNLGRYDDSIRITEGNG
jgi:hypothetical protein